MSLLLLSPPIVFESGVASHGGGNHMIVPTCLIPGPFERFASIDTWCLAPLINTSDFNIRMCLFHG
jgi:hypothetical protein